MESYDLIVIGAGSGGLTAAEFAVRFGARVALIEKAKIGGDCTWTGCVPSKALLKAARMAHEMRAVQQYGLCGGQPPRVDMVGVRAYIQQAIEEVYRYETPEHLSREGIEVVLGTARFVDAHTVQVGERTLTAKKLLITTGAYPFIPPIPGLDQVAYLTNLQLFENDHLPERFIIIGAGPIGSEIAQAYQRLGSQVTLIDVGLLPREEPEVAEVMGQVFAAEGINFVEGLVSATRQEGTEIILTVSDQEIRGDMLLVAVGRAPNVHSLDLDKAGVSHSTKGIPVDNYLRTNVKHIYAAGDCVAGNYQFTHVAGWQAVQAVRNALIPLNEKGVTDIVPWTTFTEPEVAHVGLTESQAREQFGDKIVVSRKPLARVDRAISDNYRTGFIKVVHQKNGRILGATIIAERAGEMITEYALAMKHKLKLLDLANTLHAYPTYSIGTQQLAGDAALQGILESTYGRVVTRVARLMW